MKQNNTGMTLDKYKLTVEYLCMNMERIAIEEDGDKQQVMIDMMNKELKKELKSIKSAIKFLKFKTNPTYTPPNSDNHNF